VSEAFESILSSMQLFLGPNTRAFEQEYAEYLDVKEAIGVSEGTTALYLALRACG
jgi:dTDP-4-amino-4,6-dideoxygalactose transaminase